MKSLNDEPMVCASSPISLVAAMCTELPTAIHDHIAADPTASLAHQFRLYVRHTLLPSMQRIQGLMDAHGALVELPPISFLMERFPSGLWHATSPTIYRDLWAVRTGLWEALIAGWDAGGFGRVIPYAGAFPNSGFETVNDWAIQRNEDRQRELIGCAMLTFKNILVDVLLSVMLVAMA
eukprot:SAG31_NODE_2821_length_5040_cov_14.991500_3_plen_179_part_00